MKKIRLYLGIFFCTAVILSACGRDIQRENEKQMTIVCTLFPQYDFTRQIAGDYADVVMLLAPGMESHMYDPSPKDMLQISEADMFIYTGDEMEPWAAAIVRSLNPEVRVIDLSVDIELMEEDHNHGHDHDGHDHGDHEHGYDPHYWLDLENAIQMVETITAALSEADDENAGEYRKRGAAYQSGLADLDRRFLTLAADSPSKDIAFGGRFAYGYFIHKYDLHYETVYQSCSVEADPSVPDMIRVIDYMNEENLNYIFYEELSNGTVAHRIAEDTESEAVVFTTAHNVSKDDLESGVTFLDLMEQNYQVLYKALTSMD